LGDAPTGYGVMWLGIVFRFPDRLWLMALVHLRVDPAGDR